MSLQGSLLESDRDRGQCSVAQEVLTETNTAFQPFSSEQIFTNPNPNIIPNCPSEQEKKGTQNLPTTLVSDSYL